MTQDIAVLQEEVTRLGVPLDVASIIVASFATHMTAFLETTKGIERIEPTMPKAARGMRLSLVKVRTATDKTRKELKEESLLRGKAIDGMAALITLKCRESEARLEQIEKAEERRLAAEKEELRQKRLSELEQFTDNPLLYSVADMSENEFAELLEAQKLAKQARLEAERVAAEAEEKRREAERLAEIRRQEEEKRERARLEAEIAEQRKQKEAAEAQARAERAEREAAEKKQRELQDKIEAQARAETQRLAAEKEAQRKAATAPDREKLVALAAGIRSTAIPDFAHQKLSKEIKDQLENLAQWIESQAEKL